MTDEIGDTSFGLQIGLGTIGKIGTAVVGFVGSIALARVLGPGSYGLFYVTLSIAQFLENPISGWAEASRKRMTEADFDASEALGSVFLVIGVTALVLGPAAGVVLSVLASNPVTPIAAPLLFVPMAAFWSLSKVLSGRGNFSLSVWAGTISNALQIFLMILLVVLGFGIWGMVYGTALGALAAVPLVYRWIGVRPTLPSLSSLRSIWGFARWSIPRGFVGTALQRMDLVLLGYLVSAGVAGRYQVALQASMPAVFVSGVIGRGLVGRISNLSSRGEEWHSDLRNSLSYGSILAVPILFGSLVVGEALVTTLFGSEYAGGGVFLIGLAAYRLFKTQTSPWESALSGLDNPRTSFRIALGEFVVNVVLGVSLWYFYGGLGIVAATVVTAALGYTVRVIAVRKRSSVDFALPRPLLEQIGAAGVMVIVITPLEAWLGGADGWLTLGLVLAVGAGVYGGVLLVVSDGLRTTARAILTDFYEEYVAS